MGILQGTLALALALSAAPARQDVAAAAEAFGTAQRAEFARDWGRAADFYEMADSLSPSKEALRSAAKARFSAEDLAAAATLALALKQRYGDDAKSLEVAERILDETGPALVRVKLRCDHPCVVSANSRAAGDVRGLTHDFYADPGTLDLVASFEDGSSTDTTVQGTGGETLSVRLIQPAPPPASARLPEFEEAPPEEDRGFRTLPPAYFIAGSVVTLASATALTWSGLDVLAQNDDFEMDPTQSGLDRGERGQLRTNVLIATTVAFGVATVALGVFTDWGGKGSSKRGKKEQARAKPHWTGRGLELQF